MSRTKKEVKEDDGYSVLSNEIMNPGSAKPLPPITHDDLGTPEDRRGQHTNGDTPPVPREPKDAKFFRLAVKRVPAAIKRIRHVANLANTNQYAYTPEHAAKIVDVLEAEVKALRNAFTGTKAPVEAWTL